jgi:hypothetical protein
MAEQARNSQEITSAADLLRQQSSQASRAMQEQAKAVRDISTGSSEVSKQIKMISKANVEHSRNGVMILQRLREVSEVSSSTAVEAKAIGASIGGFGGGRDFESDTPAEAATTPRRRGRKGQPASAGEGSPI